MNPIQAAKQELEASIRYCENAMSSAKQTIESMKKYQQQTGREEALEGEVERLKALLVEREDKWDALMRDKLALVAHGDRLLDENGDLEERNDASKATIQRLKDQVSELERAYKDSTHEEITMKKAWREQRELVALRDDQIAMLERRLAKYVGEKTYPFKEGDLYYVLNQLDGTWIESVWDDESERLHDSTDFPDHPHKVYFTVDQKNVLDKFKPEELT